MNKSVYFEEIKVVESDLRSIMARISMYEKLLSEERAKFMVHKNNLGALQEILYAMEEEELYI